MARFPASVAAFAAPACVLVLLAGTGAAPAAAQDPPPEEGLLASLQAGPYVGVTTGNGSTMEYALRIGTRTAPLRADVAISVIPWTPQLRCASPSNCRVRLSQEYLVGVAWSPWRHPDAPALGVRAGVARAASYFGYHTARIIGPHAALGLPTFPRAGFRIEAGAIQYSADGVGSTFRVSGMLGVQLHR